MKESGAFVALLKELLSKVDDGSVSITKHSGKISYLSLGEEHLDFREFADSVSGSIADRGHRPIAEADFQIITKYLDSVQYGTVTIKIKAAQIIGVEKNETIKVL
ncbi:MAG: YezD family protein [Treponema sp.]|jgi:hypothetical protein|nr:YezD family protein [Treponema sp.]